MLSATAVDWQDNSITYILAIFLSNYWKYNFDMCSNCLTNLCRRLLWADCTMSLPAEYSKYDLDGFMYSITECVQAACNEGNFYNPSSNEYKTSVVLLASYLEQGHTNEPQTDPNKGVVSEKLSKEASQAAEALWHLSIALHRDQCADNIHLSEPHWSKFIECANNITCTYKTNSTVATVTRLGYTLSEAAATKFEISSSEHNNES